MVSFEQMQPTIQNGEPVVSLQLAAGNTQIHNQNFHFIVKCNFFLQLKESNVNVVNGW
jgi:hypothetical protein